MALRDLLRQPPPRTGRVDWIGLRPGRGEAIVVVDRAEIVLDHGLRCPSGGPKDRAFAARPNPRGKRQVTAIQAEDLHTIASCVGVPSVAPEQTRRNLVISGLNLLACAGGELWIGDSAGSVPPARLQVTGWCTPCEKMNASVGPGGFQAMRGRGGLTLRILQGGLIRVGDPVHLVFPESPDGPQE